MLYALLLLSCSLLAVDAKIYAQFTKLECESFAPDIVLNFSCELRPSLADDSPVLYAFIRLSRDLTNITNQFKFNIKWGHKMVNYLSIAVDICQALGQAHNNYFLRMIAEEIHRISNFPLNCPFLKNVDYYLDDYQIDTRAIPSYAPELTFVSESLFYTKGTKVFRFVNYGRVNRNRPPASKPKPKPKAKQKI